MLRRKHTQFAQMHTMLRRKVAKCAQARTLLRRRVGDALARNSVAPRRTVFHGACARLHYAAHGWKRLAQIP